MSEQKVPSSLGKPGRRLWTSVVDRYELDQYELELLLEASRCVDRLDVLDGVLRSEGPMQDSPQGRRVHPAVAESRQQQLTLSRLLGALRMPAGAENDHQASARPQRRAGVRGPYSVR